MTRVALVTHGRPGRSATGVARLATVAAEQGVELLVGDDEAARHGLASRGDRPTPTLVVVLGGDGTMLRALARVPRDRDPGARRQLRARRLSQLVQPDELEDGLSARLRGRARRRRAADARGRNGGKAHVAVNDVVVTSGELGRMVELEWAVGGEDLGRVPCDGLICSTPSGSTAYNLSNGGPVLMWGIDAMATTFVAPHSLHARPLVVPRGKDVVVWNRTPDVRVAVLVDGHRVGEAGRAARSSIAPRRRAALLGTLPDATFVEPVPRELRRPDEPSRPSTTCGRRVAPGSTITRASPPADREPRPDPRGRARARAGPDRAHRRDRRREDDLHAGDRPPARREGRRGGRSAPPARGVRRGRARRARTGSSTRRGSETLARPPPGGRAGTRPRPPRVRATAARGHSPGAGASRGGSRRRDRAAARAVGPVRAAPTRPARATSSTCSTPSSGPTSRLGAARRATPGASLGGRAGGSTSSSAEPMRSAARSRSSRCSSRTPTGSSRARRTPSRRSASACAT